MAGGGEALSQVLPVLGVIREDRQFGKNQIRLLGLINRNAIIQGDCLRRPGRLHRLDTLRLL
ncbi:MAG TPA: hypothetical protein VJS18_06750 [Paraburkholderia sp.]|nr:hypothetical protein [Paraburkholderia sp.]